MIPFASKILAKSPVFPPRRFDPSLTPETDTNVQCGEKCVFCARLHIHCEISFIWMMSNPGQSGTSLPVLSSEGGEKFTEWNGDDL